MIFGVIPVALTGLLYYVVMVGILSPWAWNSSWKWMPKLRLAAVIAGIGMVLYLVYAELFQIGAICIYCTSVHIITFLIFALIAVSAALWGLAPTPLSRHRRCLAVFHTQRWPIAGAIAPSMAHRWVWGGGGRGPGSRVGGVSGGGMRGSGSCGCGVSQRWPGEWPPVVMDDKLFMLTAELSAAAGGGYRDGLCTMSCRTGRSIRS